MNSQLGLFRHASGEAMYDRGAVLSECNRYRYRLWRQWDADLAYTAFVMLNPSTADAMVDDPTIRRCVAFARSWGAGGIVVVNLYAFRATDPAQLAEATAANVSIVGPDADEHLRKAFSVCDGVVCAWGAHKSIDAARVRDVLALIPEGVEVSCLGTTKDGAPKHPLYLAASTARIPWPIPAGVRE